MSLYPKTYDVIVVGAGHAGCEAALAAARTGHSCLLTTLTLDTIAQMSCNPAIGGLAKSHIVREVDALGGEMAKNIDATAIQYRMLNTKRGPAVRALRAQADKRAYQDRMKLIIEEQENLELLQCEVTDLLTEDTSKGSKAITGVCTKTGLEIRGKTVIVTTGTFLKGLIHIGSTQFPGGRIFEPSSENLSGALSRLGFQLGRLKTGTPARLNSKSLDYSKMQEQPPDLDTEPFSYINNRTTDTQVPCYITYTTKETHEIILQNLDKAPLYSGQIKSTGPRYCPSIETKVVRFADKDRHQLFVEPEGLNTKEVYINGLSNSLPQDIQIKLIKTIPGLENAQIMKFAYAIEYDYVFPTQLFPWLETKTIENLFLAGQINGTTGYEEAAGQGIMAGINAVLKVKQEKPFILDRSEAYIGVMIDDLVTKGTNEPYRVFTSRAEYRLLLRFDNADLRVGEYGYKFGLVTEEQHNKLKSKQDSIISLIEKLKAAKHQGKKCAELLKRPDVSINDLPQVLFEGFAQDVVKAAEMEIKYEGYIKRDSARAQKLKKLENKRIPGAIDYAKVVGLKKEAIEKFREIKPVSLGQASRISGISPCDVSLLLAYLEQNR